MKIAYDLDGVLCPMPKRDKSFFKQNKKERDLYEILKRKYFEQAPLLLTPTEKQFYIISGRREKYRKETEYWLNKNHIISIETILMGNLSLTFENILNHKINWLKKLHITKFYEDDKKLVRYIKKSLPKIEVILIPRQENVIVCSIPKQKDMLF